MSSFSDLTTDFANVNFVHNHQDLYALWQNRICPVYGFDVAPNKTYYRYSRPIMVKPDKGHIRFLLLSVQKTNGHVRFWCCAASLTVAALLKCQNQIASYATCAECTKYQKSSKMSAISKACCYRIRELRCIHPYLDSTTACITATSIIYSKLD